MAGALSRRVFSGMTGSSACVACALALASCNGSISDPSTEEGPRERAQWRTQRWAQRLDNGGLTRRSYR